MLEASQAQIKKAFLGNHKSAGALQGAHPKAKNMLTFYSVECGLKYVIMVDQGQKTSRQVAEFGHNIQRLVAESKLARSEVRQAGGGAVSMPTIRLNDGNNQVSLSEFHTAMRYGIPLQDADEVTAMAFFEALGSALKKRIFA